MDPGNWATEIGAGSSDGYSLLFVAVTAANLWLVTQTAGRVN